MVSLCTTVCPGGAIRLRPKGAKSVLQMTAVTCAESRVAALESAWLGVVEPLHSAAGGGKGRRLTLEFEWAGGSEIRRHELHRCQV